MGRLASLEDLDAYTPLADPRLSDQRAPTAHQHPTGDITGLQALLDAKAAATHTHAQADVTGLVTALTGKVGTSDPRLTDARAPTAHSHAQSDVTGLAAALAARQDTSAKGQANGYASLAADGKVPAAQLPAASGAGAFSLLELAADYANATVTATDVTALGIPIAALQILQAHYYLVVDAAAGTTGIQIAILGPGSPTQVTIRWTMFNAGATPTYAHAAAFAAYQANTASAGTTRTIWEALVIVRNGNTAGTIVPSVRSEVAGSAVNVRTGSWVLYH